jgi:hypothetical protein
MNSLLLEFWRNVSSLYISYTIYVSNINIISQFNFQKTV